MPMQYAVAPQGLKVGPNTDDAVQFLTDTCVQVAVAQNRRLLCGRQCELGGKLGLGVHAVDGHPRVMR